SFAYHALALFLGGRSVVACVSLCPFFGGLRSGRSGPRSSSASSRADMALRPSVLCPIDFSDNARGALRYAATIAAHFQAPLTLLAVNDPLLEEAAALSAGPTQLTEDTQ